MINFIKILEERLARRQQLSLLHRFEENEQKHNIGRRRGAQEQTLQSLVSDGKLMERQKEELLNEYENNLRKIQMKQEEGKVLVHH